MSQDQQASDLNVAGLRRERPWMLSSNRRLRHLHGVSVRNLVVTPPNKLRGKPTDDDDIPHNLKTPTKILAQEENRGMQHSRSFTDLTLSPSKSTSLMTNGNNDEKSHDVRRRTRRRSTLPWSGGNPQTRQTKLEDITRSRMADAWFSIHCDGIDAPVYISEVVERATNPNFRFFDLNACGPHVTRRDEMTLKLWVKSEIMTAYSLLVELHLSLRSLHFVGKTLDNFHQPLPPNSVLFHFPDGIYTNLTDLPPDRSSLSTKWFNKTPIRGDLQPTSSYDALMRLANLDDCIQDALATRERLETQINAILTRSHDDIEKVKKAAQAQERMALVRRAVSAEKKQLKIAKQRKEDIVASLQARRKAMAAGRDIQDKARSHLPDAQEKMAASARLVQKNTEETKGQIRRICEDLSIIYPIEPVPGKTLSFTIAGLALPNSSFIDIDRESVAAALGYAAHLVYLLSFYLSVPIPYPVKPYLSNSIIHDPVSVDLPQRTFPLYPVSVQYRFEYGVFLLNKNIEVLMNRRGLRVFDVRHTLPNLKYLLYILTAGTSDLPARKAGGIRGLFLGRLPSSLSRQNSEDSLASNELINPRKLAELSPTMRSGPLSTESSFNSLS